MCIAAPTPTRPSSQLEQERIFGRLWIYVAHESQLKNAGRLRPHPPGRNTRFSSPGTPTARSTCCTTAARIAARGSAWSISGNSQAVQLPLSCLGVPARWLAAIGAASQELSGGLQISTIRRTTCSGSATSQSYRGFVFATLNENPAPLIDHLGPMTEVIDNLVDRAPDGEVEIADSSFTLEYRGNWKLHLENAADIFHPSFVHSSSVTPARRAPANASILDQDQTREMLLANGFGFTEWEGIQLNGLAGGHTFMTNFYSKGVLANADTDPVAARYKAALVERLGPERAASVLGMNRFNNIIYPNLIINAQYQQMRVTIPISVDRTHRAHSLLPPQGRAG